jgi:MFS transporter, DHA3 family, macrolide efflux protein
VSDAAPSTRRISGMPAFVVIWLGQLVSILASQMSQFALTVWAFERTGSATALGLVQVFFITPFLLISPVAGVLIDRYNRKLMMMLSDLGAVAASGLILVFALSGQLEMRRLYVASAVNGLFSAFQWPAYSASISLMVKNEQLGRVNGILLIDFVTFFVAIVALALVLVPQPPRSAEAIAVQGNWLKEAAFGFRYIFARPSLLGLQLVFFLGNLFGGLQWTLLAPMVLARTATNELAFAGVQTAGAIGGVLGGVLLTAWGGPKRRAHGVLAGHALIGLGWLIFGLGRAPSIWMVAVLAIALLIPVLNGSNQAIWQAKVAPDVHGRVFSARRLIAWLTTRSRRSPPACWPTARSNRRCAVATIVLGIGACGVRAVRDAEDLLPDHRRVGET